MILTILVILFFAFGFFCWWRYTKRESYWGDDGWCFGFICCWIIGGVCTGGSALIIWVITSLMK